MNKNDNLKPFKKGHKRIMPNPEKVAAKRKLKDLLTTFTEENFEIILKMGT